MNSRLVGIGFVGVGAVAELHRMALANSTAGRLVAVCGPTATDLSRGRGWGAKAYDNPADLVCDPAVDVVFVLSPVECHCEHVLLALDAGKPVLVEKPVATSVDEIAQLEKKADQAGLPCMPAHNYIYDPTIQRAKRLIEAGDLGRLCMTWIVYAIHHSEELAAHYPGILRQVIPHHLYTLLYLQGIPRRVSAMTAQLHYERLDREDQAALELEMEDGSMAHLFATFAADDDTSDPWSFMVKVLGTHGAVVHSWRNAITSRVVGTHARAYISYEESFANEDEYFLTRTLRGEAPLSTLRDARLVQSIVDAAAESARLAAAVDLSLE